MYFWNGTKQILLPFIIPQQEYAGVGWTGTHHTHAEAVSLGHHHRENSEILTRLPAPFCSVLLQGTALFSSGFRCTHTHLKHKRSSASPAPNFTFQSRQAQRD